MLVLVLASLRTDYSFVFRHQPGALGGLASTLALYPIDTIKTRIQAETAAEARENGANDNGLSWLARLAAVVNTEGIAALYSGASAKSLHSLSSSFLYFLAFTRLKTTYEERFGRKIGVGATLAAACVAGCCNVFVTEPLDTYSTWKQLERKCDAKPTASATPSTQSSEFEECDATLKATSTRVPKLNTRAAPGLYNGLYASLVLTINPAIQYTAFEQLRQRLMMALNIRAQRRGVLKPVVELSTFDAFMLGAASKAVATLLTYPLVRAKVLQKASSKSECRRSLLGTLERVYREEGVRGMYKGLEAQLVKTVLSGALALTIKEKSFKSALLLVMLLKQ